MDTEFESIIKQLITKTKKGEVIWNKSTTPNEYSLSLNAGKVLTHLYYVGHSISSGATKMVECSVENLKGEVILRASSNTETEEGSLLYSLYDSAYRAYTGKDEVIADIMNQLESSGPIGKEDDEDELPF